MRAIGVIARLTWTRLWRGRSIWVTGALAAIALGLAALQLAVQDDPARRWQAASEFWLRFLVTIAAAVHLSGAVGEEIEAQTYTYLWVRPMPRAAVLLGKLAALVPALVALSTVTLLVGYLIATGGAAGAHTAALLRTIAAAAAGALAASAFAAGAGALFPRHPFIFTLGWFLVVEQALAAIPNLKVVSLLRHTRVIAGLDGGSIAGALAGLVIVSALALGLGIVRLRRT